MREIDLQLLQKIKYCEMGEKVFRVLFYVFFLMSVVYLIRGKGYVVVSQIGKNRKRSLKRKRINKIMIVIIIFISGIMVYHSNISVAARELSQSDDSKLSVVYKDMLYIESKERSPDNINRNLKHNMEQITSSSNEVFLGENNEINLYIEDEYFDPDDIQIELYRIEYDDLKEREQKIIYKEFNWEEEETDFYSCSIQFPMDGHYKIKAYYKEDVEKKLQAEKNSETERCIKDGYYESPLYTVDTKKPMIKEIFCNQKSERKVGERQYFVEVPEIIIRIEEENFNKTDFSLQGTMFLADGREMESSFQKLKRKIGDLQWKAYYKDGKRMNEASILLETEANYLLETQCIDGAGQEGEVKKLQVTYDCQKPIIVYTGRDNESGDLIFKAEEKADGKSSLLKFRKYHFFRYFSKERISINVQVKDEVSGVEKINYVFISQNKEKGKKNKASIVERRINQEDKENSAGDLGKKDLSRLAVTVKPEEENFKGSLSVWGQDYCGNIGANITSKGMISESEKFHREASNITIKIPLTDFTDKENNINYYNGKVPVYVIFEDKNSGLYKTSIQGKIEGDISEERKSNVVEDIAMWDGNEITYRKKQVLLLESDNISQKKGLITIEAKLEDNAGNISEEVLDTKIVIDNIKPEIQVTYDSNNEQGYYNCPRKATVKIKEHNFNPAYVKWDIQGSNKNYRISEWKSEQDMHICEVFFDKEGEDYAINLSVMDCAGNKTEWRDRSYFTIDQTIPKVSISLEKEDGTTEREVKDIQEIQDGLKDTGKLTYFNKKQTVLFHIQEKNLDKSKIEYNIQAINGKKKVAIKEPSKYIEKGEEYYGRLELDQEANYKIGIRCTDKAGNQSEWKQLQEFIIDTTTPQVIVQGVKNNEICRGKSIQPRVLCKDKYLEPETVKVIMIRANGNKIPESEWSYERIQGEKETQYVWDNLSPYKNGDGIYELLIKGRDKAGNNISNKQKVVFRVNRRGAKFTCENSLKKKLEQGYLNEIPDIVLKEQCVSKTNSTVVILKDNEYRKVLKKKKLESKRGDVNTEEEKSLKSSEISKLEEKSSKLSKVPSIEEKSLRLDKLLNLKKASGYVLKERIISDKKSSQFGWYEKKYNIEKDNFSEEGDYRVTVQADFKKFNMHFIIDKTAPVVNIGNLEEQQYDEKEHEFTINVMDNYGLDRLELYIEKGGNKYLGEKIKKRIITSEDLEKSPIVKEKLIENAGYQTIRYIAWDKAGNKTDSDENGDTRRCLVTKNKILKKTQKSNKNYITEAITGTIIIGIIGYIIVRRYARKRRIL